MARPRASRKNKEAAPAVEEEVEVDVEDEVSDKAETSELDMEDIRRDIETKCSALQAFSEEATLALRSELKIQLLKMPKKVRNMPLKDFLSNFAGDINKVIVDELNARFIQIENPPFEPKTAARGRGRGRKAGATTCKKPAAPSTVMATRTTRKRARDAAAAADGGGIAGTVLRTTRSRMRSNSMAIDNPQDNSHVLNSPNPRLVLNTPAPTSRTTRARGGAAKTQQAVARQPFTPLVTSANTNSLGLPPNTVLRHAKKGEIFFSKNGSPLGMVAGSPAYDQEGDDQENSNVMMMTPMVGASGKAKQWTSKSTIKTCATVRCRTRTTTRRNGRAAEREETEEEASALASESEEQKINSSSNAALSPEDLQILLTNEDGEEINLDGTDNGDLPVDIKSLALGKLMGLQNKVMGMIASLGHAK